MLNEEEPNDDQIDEMPRKRVKTENCAPDEEVRPFNAPISGTQQTIKREPGSDGQTENDQPGPKKEPKEPILTETTSFECYDFNDLIKSNQSRMKAESGGLFPMVAPDQAGIELPPDSSANLKVIYDVKYKTPC